MGRNISWNTYFIALVISVLVFSVGLLVGAQISQGTTAEVQKQLEELQSQNREMELLAVLQTSFPDASGSFCEFYSNQMEKFGKQTADFGNRLDFLERKRGRTDASVQELKTEYSTMEVRDFLLMKQVNEKCGKKTPTILYFYTNENCPLCTRQGEVLTSIKSGMPEVMIYSFDTDLHSSAIDAMLSVFKVTEMPSIVVNEKAYGGFKSREEVIAALAENNGTG